MGKIKFGTDGWRAIIAQEFTVNNVARVAMGTAKWLQQNFDSPSVCIGHDCRFGGQLFTEATAKVLLNEGIKVYMASGDVSTPMVSMGTLHHKTNLGVVLTASHNPPSYNGYKLKGDFGGPLLPADVQAVEDLIPDKVELPNISLEEMEKKSLLEHVDLETMYLKAVQQAFDLKAIKASGLKLAFDAMYGAGQDVIRRILPETILLHCDKNPSFMGQAPEPIERNLQPFQKLIREKGTIDLGLAVDGDADRIGLFNKKGEFVDSHRIILLLINYLHKVKQMSGKVVTAFSTSIRIAQLCEAYGIETITTKIGFKYIAGYMINEDVLVGGEESGGIACKGHIPERDGIWIGLVLLEYMAKSGKSLDELLEEVYDIIGDFSYDRIDLKVPEEKKHTIIAKCKANEYKAFGKYQVQKLETIDGYKYFFDDKSTCMIRPSGTEPLLRVYSEAPTKAEVDDILKTVIDTILA